MHAVASWFHVAATYGSNSFGTSEYSTAVQVGPLTLPDTGAAMALGGAILLAVAGGIVAWVVQSRKRSA